jgi:FtsH-binding integral membrane protein
MLQELSWQNLRSSTKSMGFASYALLAVLFALLVFAVVTADIGWQSAAGTDVPPVGYVMMVFGIVLSVFVGAGLMALVFYSNRSGYDEPARLIGRDRDEASK